MHRQPPLHLLQQIKIPHRFRKLNFSSKPIEKPRPIINYRGTKASPAISLLLCSGRISDPAEVLSLIRPRPPALLCSAPCLCLCRLMLMLLIVAPLPSSCGSPYTGPATPAMFSDDTMLPPSSVPSPPGSADLLLHGGSPQQLSSEVSRPAK